MSTRCNIGIYGEIGQRLNSPDFILYKHWDGYPEGTLPMLKEFAEIKQNRAIAGDSEYYSAWLIHFLIERYKGEIKSFNDKKEDEIDHLGHGICKDIHGDIEYYYAMYPDRIEVYSAEWDKGFKGMKKIETIQFPWVEP